MPTSCELHEYHWGGDAVRCKPFERDDVGRLDWETIERVGDRSAGSDTCCLLAFDGSRDANTVQRLIGHCYDTRVAEVDVRIFRETERNREGCETGVRQTREGCAAERCIAMKTGGEHG